MRLELEFAFDVEALVTTALRTSPKARPRYWRVRRESFERALTRAGLTAEEIAVELEGFTAAVRAEAQRQAVEHEAAA